MTISGREHCLQFRIKDPHLSTTALLWVGVGPTGLGVFLRSHVVLAGHGARHGAGME